jgi:hypothetical protein
MIFQEVSLLAQRLYAEIPVPLQHWTGVSAEIDERDRLAAVSLALCEDAGLGSD